VGVRRATPIEPPATPFAESVAAAGLVEAYTASIAIGPPLAWWRGSTSSWPGGSRRGMPCSTLDDRHPALRSRSTRAGSGGPRRAFEATLADTREQLRFAERVQNPLAISAEELSRHRHAVETMAVHLQEARAAVAVVDAEVRAVETEIERRTVRAPMAGEVLQFKLRAGELALAGHNAAPLIVLGAVHPLHLRVDADEHETSRLFPAARAYAYPRGNAGLKTEVTFVRFDPMMVPKRCSPGTARPDGSTRAPWACQAWRPAISSPAAAVSSHSVPPSTGRFLKRRSHPRQHRGPASAAAGAGAPRLPPDGAAGLEAVENALVTHREARRRFDKLRVAEGVERRAVALAHYRYRSGLVDVLDRLETKRTLYARRPSLLRGEGAVSRDLVRLYKALGGGWGHDTAKAQVTPSLWPISSKE
jgi:HlyD family secretion protein